MNHCQDHPGTLGLIGIYQGPLRGPSWTTGPTGTHEYYDGVPALGTSAVNLCTM